MVKILDINEEECTLQELISVINEMRNNKASGLDKITAEALKVESVLSVITFLQYINEVINNNEVLFEEEWQKNIIIVIILYKERRSLSVQYSTVLR
jgi:hypothetical protein